MGLADIVPLVWLGMAAFFGWKRMGKIELASFVSVTAAFALAFFLAPILGKAVASPSKAVTAPWVFYAVLWIGLWVGFAQLSKKWLTQKAGSRVSFDEHGRPKMGAIWLSKFMGAFWGVLRGIVLYIAIVSALMVLVPTFLYKKGRGTAVVHPDSRSMQAIIHWHPELRKLEEAAGGLRVLHLRHRRTQRRLFKSNRSLQRLLKRKDIRALLKKRELLRRANHRRQGRRSATLLLWMPDFQRIFANPETLAALTELNQSARNFKITRKRKRRKKRKR